MAVAPPSTREQRMITTLLATCDPCGYVDAGQAPYRYNPLAGRILHLFRRRRSSPSDIVLEFPGEADAARAVQFAFAVVAWWNEHQDAMWRARGGPART